jgi:type I restriction enzyme S subunit
MSSEWHALSIGEIGKVVTGKTPSTSTDSYFGGSYPFYTPSDMDGRKFMDATKRTLSSEGIESIKGSIIDAGAVMVSCIGSDMGKVAIAAQQGATNQQINSILVSDQFDPEYIYYELSTRKDALQMLATSGSAQPILNKGHFCQIEIRVPLLKEQKAIAHILGTLDDKIELNRQTNETLEAMAKALFQSWFVDFDPVRAKVEGRPTGLPEEISELFPDSFEEAELGEIPMGWEIAAIELSILERIRSTHLIALKKNLITTASPPLMLASLHHGKPESR